MQQGVQHLQSRVDQLTKGSMNTLGASLAGEAIVKYPGYIITNLKSILTYSFLIFILTLTLKAQ